MRNSLYIGAALVAVAMLYGAFQWAKGQGYDACTAENEAATEALQEKLNRANEKAAAAADAYMAQLAEIEALKGDLTDEAMQDPDAGARSLGADSVRRLNRIR